MDLFGDESGVLDALFSSESEQWFTPPSVIAAARRIMGGIDLDPASCAEANARVGAVDYYEEGGLQKPWYGRVFLNPPYGRDDSSRSRQDVWSSRLRSAVEAGNVSQAVLVVNAETGSRWFQPLWDYTVCLVSQRLRFLKPGGGLGSAPTHSNAVIYFGSRVSRALHVLGDLGRTIPPRPARGNLSLEL